MTKDPFMDAPEGKPVRKIGLLMTLLGLFLLLLQPGPAQAAGEGQPLRLAVECKAAGRTRACPDLLHGIINEYKILHWSSLQDAQVVLFWYVTPLANDDQVLGHFESRQPDGPRFDLHFTIPARGDENDLVPLLKTWLLRGLAPFLAIHAPEVLSVDIAEQRDGGFLAYQPSSPWSTTLSARADGAYQGQYQDGSLYSFLELSYLTAAWLWRGILAGEYSLERAPDLLVDDKRISLDSTNWSGSISTVLARNLDEHWAVGGYLRGGSQDVASQYDRTGRCHFGLEYDFFPSDDPRGNRIALLSLIGVQADKYNKVNVLNENTAIFPTIGLLGTGSVRKETTNYTLNLGLIHQIPQLRRRYLIRINPSASLQLGDHIDLDFNLSIDRQASPGPAFLDQASYNEISQAAYAEPLQLSAGLGLTLHWDRTNRDQNNRFSSLSPFGAVGSF